MSIRVTLTRPTRGPTRNRSTASDCDGTDLLLFIGTADLDLLIGGSPADAIAIATNIAGEKRVLSTTEGTPQGERSHPLCPKVLELGIHLLYNYNYNYNGNCWDQGWEGSRNQI